VIHNLAQLPSSPSLFEPTNAVLSSRKIRFYQTTKTQKKFAVIATSRESSASSAAWLLTSTAFGLNNLCLDCIDLSNKQGLIVVALIQSKGIEKL
jgi:hypothetical protein